MVFVDRADFRHIGQSTDTGLSRNWIHITIFDNSPNPFFFLTLLFAKINLDFALHCPDAKRPGSFNTGLTKVQVKKQPNFIKIYFLFYNVLIYFYKIQLLVIIVLLQIKFSFYLHVKIVLFCFRIGTMNSFWKEHARVLYPVYATEQIPSAWHSSRRVTFWRYSNFRLLYFF